MISLYDLNSNDIFDDKLNYDYNNYDIYLYSDGIFTKPNKTKIYEIELSTINHIKNYLVEI